MKPLKIAVAGLSVGCCHIESYLNSAYSPDIYLCDRDTEKLRQTGERYDIAPEKLFAEYDEMLEIVKPDAVSVCVPNYLHKPFTLKALEFGAHVLCEKPMSICEKDALEMKAAAERAGKILMINFNQRFLKECQTARKLVLQGSLGEIYYARTTWNRRRGVPWWYPLAEADRTCGGGPLIDIGCHVLDRTLFICGFPEPEWVLGAAYCAIAGDEACRHGIERFSVEDMGVAMLRMKNGMMLELEASWASNREGEQVKTRILGTKGGLLMCCDFDGGSGGNTLFFEDEAGNQTNIELDSIQTDHQEDIRVSFMESILNGTPPVCSAEQGCAVSRILDGIYLSSQKREPVHL